MNSSPVGKLWGLSPKALKIWGGKIPAHIAEITSQIAKGKTTLKQRQAIIRNEMSIKLNQLLKGVK